MQPVQPSHRCVIIDAKPTLRETSAVCEGPTEPRMEQRGPDSTWCRQSGAKSDKIGLNVCKYSPWTFVAPSELTVNSQICGTSLNQNTAGGGGAGLRVSAEATPTICCVTRRGETLKFMKLFLLTTNRDEAERFGNLFQFLLFLHNPII